MTVDRLGWTAMRGLQCEGWETARMDAAVFRSLLAEGPLLADGGMGTSLIARGVPVDACMEELNVRAPAKLDYPDHVCSDPPAWWLLKRKKTRDWTGVFDARAARVDM